MSSDDEGSGPSSDPRGSSPPLGPAPMGALAATGWALGATFLYMLFVATLTAVRPGAERDLVSGVACQAMAYFIVLFGILRVHAPEAGVRGFVGMRSTHALFYPLALCLGVALEAPANALDMAIERRWPSHAEDQITAIFQSSSPGMRVALALVVILVGPMLEELFFRGALFKPMLKVHPAAVVIGVTATLFAIAHAPAQIWLPIGLLGVVLGYLRRASGSLVPGMVLHGTFNAIPFYAMAARRPGTPEVEGPIPLSIVGVSVAAVMLLLGCIHLVGRTMTATEARSFDRR